MGELRSFNIIMDVIAAAAGIYMLYCWFKMKLSGTIIGGMLMPKDLDVKKCLDPKGFLQKLLPNLLISGAMLLACGLLMLAGDVSHGLPAPLDFLPYALSLCTLIFYAIYQKKLIDRFWPGKTEKKPQKKITRKKK